MKREPGVENEDPEDDDDDDDDRDDGNGMDTGTDDGSGSGGVPPAPVVKPEPLTPKQLKAKVPPGFALRCSVFSLPFPLSVSSYPRSWGGAPLIFSFWSRFRRRRS